MKKLSFPPSLLLVLFLSSCASILPENNTTKDSESEQPVKFTVIEKAPLFPGCSAKLENKERTRCLSKKIGRYVNRHFNTDLASDLGLFGKVRIMVQFRVNKDGVISNIKAHSKHPELSQEAKRVLSNLPKLQPAMQHGKAVSLPYSLPIVFMIAE